MRAGVVTIVVVLGGALGAGDAARCNAVPSVESAGNRLDDELLMGLDDDLFGAKDARAGEGPGANRRVELESGQTATDPHKGAPVRGPASPEPLRVPAGVEGRAGPVLGKDSGVESRDHVLHRIERQMRSAQARMGRPAAYTEIFRLQDDIVRELQTLVDSLRRCRGSRRACRGLSGQAGPKASPPSARQPKSGRAGGQNPTGQPSGRADGDAGVAEGSTPVGELLGEAWGHLPERARERVMQWSDEQFLPKYEVQIEQYFERLAEPPPGEGQ